MDKQQRKHIGDQIQHARESRGWSPGRLAEEAHMATGTVRSLEAGKNVRPSSLAKAMDALDLEPEVERMDRAGDPPDVHVVLEVIRLWLTRMDEGDRPEAIYTLMRAMTGEAEK